MTPIATHRTLLALTTLAAAALAAAAPLGPVPPDLSRARDYHEDRASTRHLLRLPGSVATPSSSTDDFPAPPGEAFPVARLGSASGGTMAWRWPAPCGAVPEP